MTFNSLFTDTVDDLLNKNNSHTKKQTPQYDIKTVLSFPGTENEDENVINTSIGKSSVGFDEIPGFLVKRCLYYINKSLAHIFNITVKFGIFPDLMEIAKLCLTIKRVMD